MLLLPEEVNTDINNKRKIKTSKIQLLGEEIANAISHGVMILFAISIFICLCIYSDNPIKIVGAIIYGICFVLVFTFSCLYHSISHKFTKYVIFKRFDHISIYLMIGGTYAPILLNLSTLVDSSTFIPHLHLGLLLFIIQWILIVLGIVFKSIWLKKYHFVHIISYIVIGWTASIAFPQIYQAGDLFFWLVLCGGVIYTIGVIFYAKSSILYFHFVWHIFVCVAAILHALAILLVIYK